MDMKPTFGIEKMIKSLVYSSGPDFVEMYRQSRLNISEFNAYSSWSTDKYTRNCIAKSERYELILLCWEPGQKTPVHCHGGEECWVMMIDGVLTEDRYSIDDEDQLVLEQSREIQGHVVSYMRDDIGLHTLGNDTDHRARSLHLYMNPIPECSVYDVKTGASIPKKMKYDTNLSTR